MKIMIAILVVLTIAPGCMNKNCRIEGEYYLHELENGSLLLMRYGHDTPTGYIEGTVLRHKIDFPLLFVAPVMDFSFGVMSTQHRGCGARLESRGPLETVLFGLGVCGDPGDSVECEIDGLRVLKLRIVDGGLS